MHLNKEKASHCQVKPEESHAHTSRSPTVSTLHKSNAQDETRYAVHMDVRLPVQPSAGIMSAGRQKIVSHFRYYRALLIKWHMNSLVSEAVVLLLSGQWQFPELARFDGVTRGATCSVFASSDDATGPGAIPVPASSA